MKNAILICIISVLLNGTNAYSQQFAWVKTIAASTSHYDGGVSVVSDNSGNVYSTGFFGGNTTTGSTSLTGGGTPDVYVLKHDANGNLLWTYITNTSTSGSTYPSHMTIDQNGNLYIVGTTTTTYSVNFNPSGSALLAASSIQTDVFVLKLDSNGNFLWVKGIGGTGAENVSKVSLDNNGNLLIVGDFDSSTDFIPGSGSNILTPIGGKDIYLLSLNSNNGTYNWVDQIGGSTDDYVYDVEINNQGEILMAGSFTGTVDFDPSAGTYNLSSSGSEDIYLAKYSSTGAFINALSFGGTSSDRSNSVEVDANDNIYLTGIYTGTVDFDPGSGTSNMTSTIDGNTFNICLSNSNILQWVNSFASNGVIPIETTIKNNILYLTGGFGGTCDFDPGVSTYNLSAIASANDIYIVRLGLNGSFISAHELNSSNPQFNRPADIFVGSDISIYLTGYVEGTVDMDPGAGTQNITGGTYWRGYTLKLNSLCYNTSSSASINACGSYTAPDSQVFNTSGNYSVVIPNSQGCDSTISLNLTIQQPSSSAITIDTCDSYTAPDGAIYNSSGIYSATIPNAVGCDSVITINLTILNSSSSTLAPTACGSYTAPDGTVHTTSGTFTSVIPNAVGCDSTITVNLIVNPYPTVDAGTDQTVCEGISVTLNATGATTYTWDNGAANGSTITPTGTATYTVTGTSAGNCTSTDQVTITIASLPVASFSSNVTSGCGPLQVSFTNTTLNTQTISWSFGNGSTSNVNNPLVVFPDSGCFDVSMSVTDQNGCSVITTFTDTICVFDIPVAGFNSSSSTISDNQSVTFTNTSTGATSYLWDLGDGSQTQTSFNVNHLYDISNEDSIIVQLIVYAVSGCSDTSYLVIPVATTPTTDTGLNIPTGFSPNNDGENDSWTITGLENYPKAVIQVFNRWGQLLFDGGPSNPSWDGYFQGKLLPTADYYFIIDLGTDEKINGIVTLKQ
jgi:gliding motility-associated-like protein